MHIPDSLIVSNHPCSNEIVPECIELMLVSRLIEAASAVWDPLRYDFLVGMAVKMFITPFVSMSSEMRSLGMWKSTSFLLMACFHWNKQPTATLDGNSVFIVDSIACSKSDV